MRTIEELKYLKEAEDRVEFKKGEGGNIAYSGGDKVEPKKRRRCILGYVTALCNEGGGSLVIGMSDEFPHQVTGTRQAQGAIGQLEADIYRDTQIRTTTYELFEDDKRVLVIDVPARPFGQVFKFEDVPLMRVGDELLPMADEVYLKIIQEQEPDFSAQICKGITINEIDDNAVEILKQKYAKKQNNPAFLTLSKYQVLTDLDLMVDNQITNAALILLGKEEVLRKTLPQAAIMLEFRRTEPQIIFDNRKAYRQPFFIMIEELWRDIDLRNGSFQVKDGPYIFEIPYFNEDVIREAINNAIAHRDYRRESETVIKQYPQKMTIINIGGFPLGVSQENLLTVPSTPRNRLLADVLSKTGIVERSGQGVDKIYRNTLSEGKDAPDYSKSDRFMVELTLSSVIKDKAFALFIDSVQQNLSEEEKLSVFDIITLGRIRNGDSKDLDKNILKNLESQNLIEKRGKTKGVYYILSRSYYEFTDNEAEYSKKSDWDISQVSSVVLPYLAKYGKAKMGGFAKLLEGNLTRRQVRVFIQQMVTDNILISEGKGSGTFYRISDTYHESSELMNKALSIGIEELQKRGEI